jgi:hypothetical protein
VKINRRAVLAAVAGMLSSAAFAAPAQATLTISSFSVTPSTLQAGGTSANPGPNLSVDAQFGTSDGDTPQNVKLSLAPGLLANPNIPLCTAAQFAANNCPASSNIASGYATGTAPQYGLTLNLPTNAYLIQPTGSEIARLGIITTFFDYPVATISAPVTLRQTPNVGVDLPITGLPNTIDGTTVIIHGLHLVINGEMDGKPFTRNPTSCSPATTNIAVESYGQPSTDVTSSSSFTPTGCSNLAYAPTIAGSAALDTNGDDGIAVSETITQKYEESDNQSVNLIMPFSLSPNLKVLGSACSPANPTDLSASNLASCSAIGTASVTTPLLANPLNANIYLLSHTGSIPTLEIALPDPIGITLTATPILTGQTVQALVTNIPDVPLSSLTINLPGGPNALFLGGTHFCTVAQVFGGNFTAWSGATASPTAAATISGCPASSPAAVSSAPATSSAPLAPSSATTTTDTSSRTSASTSTSGTGSSSPTGQASFTGLATDHATLTLAVGTPKRGGGSLHAVSVRLPTGLAIKAAGLARGLTVKLDGKSVSAKYTLSGGVLTLTFSRPGQVAIVTIKAPALVVAGSSATQVREHKAGKLTLRVLVRNTNGRSSELSLNSVAR